MKQLKIPEIQLNAMQFLRQDFPRGAFINFGQWPGLFDMLKIKAFYDQWI